MASSDQVAGVVQAILQHTHHSRCVPVSCRRKRMCLGPVPGRAEPCSVCICVQFASPCNRDEPRIPQGVPTI
jgi:hypothetical protein